MATTKWLDPAGWSLADWTDESLTVLIDHLWNTLKGAADERQAFAEFSHSGGFDSDNTFPDLSDLKSIFNSSSSSPNNAAKIKNAVLHPDLTVVETDSIKADGTAAGSAEANYLTLSEILTDIFSYASGDLLHMIDSTNGTENALLSMAWVKQWYQVMDYPEYYGQVIAGDFFDEVETMFIEISVEYDYDIGSSSPGFDKADCDLTAPESTSTTVDIYVANDLNESAPFSSSQDVFDYAVSQLNSQKASHSWKVRTGAIGIPMKQEVNYRLQRVGTGVVDEYTYTVEIRENTRIRFKPNDLFRALSPNVYTALIYKYFYLDSITSLTFNDFGASLNEDESKFQLITDPGDGYFYLNIEGADYSNFTVPADPGQDSTVTADEGNELKILSPGNSNDIFVQANNSDGTAFEWYTP